MSRWLNRLKSQNTPDIDHTKTTETIIGVLSVVSVGSIAEVLVKLTKSCSLAKETDVAEGVAASNDSVILSDQLDRWCWPNSDAMNSAEVDSFASRVSLFSRQGIAIEKSEFLSDSLRQRDRRRDDRRVCIECTHLKRGKCGNYRAAGLQASDIGTDLSVLLQRCKGFTAYSFII